MIQLKDIRPEQENIILDWLNNPEICKYNSHAVFPATPFVPDNKTVRFGIFDTNYYPERLIGVISLQKIDIVSRSAELAILIGDYNPRKDPRITHFAVDPKTNETIGDVIQSYRRKGVGKEAARLICEHGFKQLNLHRIYCGTHEENIGMQKVAKALGMTLEGRTRQSFYKHGVYADTLHYGLLREEWKEI